MNRMRRPVRGIEERDPISMASSTSLSSGCNPGSVESIPIRGLVTSPENSMQPPVFKAFLASSVGERGLASYE
jgi:hypothetical protein